MHSGPIVRLTIKATGRSSTDLPSSISLRVTPTHVRRARSGTQTVHAPRQLHSLRRSGLLRMCFKAALHEARLEADPDLMRPRGSPLNSHSEPSNE